MEPYFKIKYALKYNMHNTVREINDEENVMGLECY